MLITELALDFARCVMVTEDLREERINEIT